MQATIVKQDLAIIVAFCYNICLIRKPVITILKMLVVKIVCVRTSYHYEDLGAILAIFLNKKIAILTPFG